jgi:hypothetical protein
MIIDFKTFINEGRSNWWLKKPVNDDQYKLFKEYKKYEKFFIKTPNASGKFEVFTTRIECIGSNSIDRDIDILMDIITPFTLGSIADFFKDAYGYIGIVDCNNYFPKYKWGDIYAANILINKINDAIKDKFGPEYGVFPTK